MTTERIHARAPTRIDLAGGTLDIWPLFTFLRHPVTVNLGINLFAEATLEKTSGGRVILESEDQKTRVEFDWRDLTSRDVVPSLELPLRLLRHFSAEKRALGGFDEKQGVHIRTRCQSPAGAGIGGSSALGVALSGALASWSRNHAINPETDGEALIAVIRDVETTVIRVPAGVQDYYGAMFGGLQRLTWGLGGFKRERLPENILRGLESRLLLFYSGQSRNSGINNWALFKSFIDGTDDTRSRFESLGESASRLADALVREDWRAAEQAIGTEWTVRRTLASGITTATIDEAFRVGAGHGAASGKVCGAGGGGCFFLFQPANDPEKKRAIREDIISRSPDLRPLDFRAVSHGLEVRIGQP